MSAIQHFTNEQAREFGDKFGIDWDWSFSNVEQFPMKSDSKLEHHNPSADMTGNGVIFAGKIALSNLNEFADYDSRLKKLEREAREENIRGMKHGYICWRNSLGVS
jgi:hypothetical protein